jgi:hypothetical protein
MSWSYLAEIISGFLPNYQCNVKIIIIETPVHTNIKTCNIQNKQFSCWDLNCFIFSKGVIIIEGSWLTTLNWWVYNDRNQLMWNHLIVAKWLITYCRDNFTLANRLYNEIPVYIKFCCFLKTDTVKVPISNH